MIDDNKEQGRQPNICENFYEQLMASQNIEGIDDYIEELRSRFGISSKSSLQINLDKSKELLGSANYSFDEWKQSLIEIGMMIKSDELFYILGLQLFELVFPGYRDEIRTEGRSAWYGKAYSTGNELVEQQVTCAEFDGRQDSAMRRLGHVRTLTGLELLEEGKDALWGDHKGRRYKSEYATSGRGPVLYNVEVALGEMLSSSSGIWEALGIQCLRAYHASEIEVQWADNHMCESGDDYQI
jgi:hypothetical protein